MIDDGSFSLGEIEIEPDEVQESYNQNEIQGDNSALKYIIDHKIEHHHQEDEVSPRI
jgi:hypothetical protein